MLGKKTTTILTNPSLVCFACSNTARKRRVRRSRYFFRRSFDPNLRRVILKSAQFKYRGVDRTSSDRVRVSSLADPKCLQSIRHPFLYFYYVNKQLTITLTVLVRKIESYTHCNVVPNRISRPPPASAISTPQTLFFFYIFPFDCCCYVVFVFVVVVLVVVVISIIFLSFSSHLYFPTLLL